MVIFTKINKLLQQFSEWCDLSGGKKLKIEDQSKTSCEKLFRFLNFQSHEFIELVKESLCVNSVAEYY